jgi:hypothetical protein
MDVNILTMVNMKFLYSYSSHCMLDLWHVFVSILEDIKQGYYCLIC